MRQVIASVLFLLCMPQHEKPGVQQPKQEYPCGFTIIEAGKAVDCKGDTIKLERTINGWLRSRKSTI